MEKTETLPPAILVIFGITGDLAQRKLLPAIAQIDKHNQLPEEFKLLGISRRPVSADEVLSKSCKSLLSMTELFQMNLEDHADYHKLKLCLAELSKNFKKPPQIIFYFAVPPAAILPIIRRLGASGLNGEKTKLLLEKPFGVDYESAKELIAETDKHFKEEQAYRIDHYLAKEMAQNIAVFIGANALFRDIWNNRFISKIEIIASEQIGIEGRTGFYEQTGALRDFVQSHLMQLTALVLMKPCPDVFDFSDVSRRRLEALSAVKPIQLGAAGQVLRGQYEGYQKEVGNPGSTIETFVALELESSDPTWTGVPIRLVTGKCLEQKFTEIRIYFKKTQAKEANLLTFRIQPREGIDVELWVKQPGYEHELKKLPLSFSYEQYFGDSQPDAYEQVLVDAMRGSQNLFASSSEILASWKILNPVLHKWSMDNSDLILYKPGSSYKQVLKSVS